jgi:hypothetical protein
MAQAGRAASPRELDERTKAMRDKRKTNVDYELGCKVETAGISGRIVGERTGNCLVTFSIPGSTGISLREDQLEDVRTFLDFARNECEELRHAYERVGATN